MGILVMENFDVADLATMKAAPHNFDFYTHNGMNSVEALKTFTEEGIRRTSYVEVSNTFDGSGGAYGKSVRIPLPIPADNQVINRTYYASMRIRFISGNFDPKLATPSKTLPGVTTYLALSTVATQYGIGNMYNVATITAGSYVAGGDANKLRLFAGNTVGSTTTQTQFTPDADGWFHLEVFKPVGSMVYNIWLNDFLYIPTAATANPGGTASATTNFLNVYFGRTSSYFAGSWGFEITDIIVIDPTTPGQQYRYGSTGRVLSMDYTSDVVNDWTADPSATLTHRQMMMVDKSVPDATNILSSTAVGQREQYAVQPVPAKFGPYVPAVALMPRVMNAGAAAHSLAMEMDWGAGRTEVGSKTVSPGGAYDTTPLIMTTKPNGDPWTAADFASAKAGFSVKS